MPTKMGIATLSGALGITAGFGMLSLMNRIAGNSFPWGTMVVNLIGCFLAGMRWRMLD